MVLYRENRETDPSSAEKHAAKATEYLRVAPTLAGKKRFMAKQLPFDVFVTRKISKWETTAKEWNVPLLDAIGADPVEEMIFFWNGHSRMTKEGLEKSLSKLEWSNSEANKNRDRLGAEEQAIIDLVRAAALRALRRHEESEVIITTRVLIHDKSLFKANLRDDWVLPVAHYEMAANLWMERPTYIKDNGRFISSSEETETEGTSDNKNGDGDGEEKNSDSDFDKSLEIIKTRECKKHIKEVENWESYELDARVGLKVTTATNAIQKWENSHALVL